MPPSNCIELDAAAREALLQIARRSIEQGFATQAPLAIDLADCASQLREPAAVFTTLTQSGKLRGCIGSLEAREALAQAISTAAYNSAFGDRRFAPLRRDEVDSLRIEISVLSPMQPLHAESRAGLLKMLRPGIDGLLLEDSGWRATFLPRVWDDIPSAEAFVGQLMLKGGKPADHWSDSIRVQRYTTLSFAEN